MYLINLNICCLHLQDSFLNMFPDLGDILAASLFDPRAAPSPTEDRLFLRRRVSLAVTQPPSCSRVLV